MNRRIGVAHLIPNVPYLFSWNHTFRKSRFFCTFLPRLTKRATTTPKPTYPATSSLLALQWGGRVSFPEERNKMCEKNLFERACRLWADKCQKENWIPDQPGTSDSEVDLESGMVILRNCNGVLAVYRYYPESDCLRYVEVEDAADQGRPQVQRERSRT